jgi:pimeloyl-ACP methyl ester carboxylesterase
MRETAWSRQRLHIRVDDDELSIDALVAAGPEPVVFLHGFGSTKEEYADFVRFPGLPDRGFVAYDAPGFGGSMAGDPTRVSVPYLVDVALAVLDQLGIDRFHVVGHSMGGLTALLLAGKVPDRVLSFIDIEGNVAPEDCFLSRQILTHDAGDPAVFLRDFAARAHAAPMRAPAVKRVYGSNPAALAVSARCRRGAVLGC